MNIQPLPPVPSSSPDEPSASSVPGPTPPATGEVDGPQWLSDFWDKPLETITPSLVKLENSERRLLFPGKSHSIFAPSNLGKTYVALQMALQVIRETGRAVLFLDCEASLDVVLTRFRQLGGLREDAGRFAYWRMHEAVQSRAEQLNAFVVINQVALVVLDGVTQACAAEGIDADRDNTGYTQWYQRLSQAVGATGEPTNPALLLLDHFSEKTGRGSEMYSRGATAKRDTITATAWKLTGRNFSKERGSTLQLLNAKCRIDGTPGEAAANVVVTPSGNPDGSLTVRFVAPTNGAPIDPLGDVKRAIAETLADKAMSVRQLRETVGGDKDRFQPALDDLRERGVVSAATDEPKNGGHHPLTLVKPYRDAEPTRLQEGSEKPF